MKSIEKQALNLLLLNEYLEKYVKVDLKEVIPNYDEQTFLAYMDSLPIFQGEKTRESITKYANELYRTVSKKFPKK